MNGFGLPRALAVIAAVCAFLAVAVWPIVGYSWRQSAGMLLVAGSCGMVARAEAAQARARRRRGAVGAWAGDDHSNLQRRRAS